MRKNKQPIQLQFSKILSVQIDMEDETFSLLPNTPDTPDSLRKSIASFGLLHPPILRMGHRGSYQVVAGRKRIQAAIEELNLSIIPAQILPPDTSELETLLIALEETKSSRPLSAAEIAIFCQKIIKWSGGEKNCLPHLSTAGLQPELRVLKKYCKIVELEEPLLLALHSGNLKERVAHELAGMSFVDRLALFEIIEYLSLSASNQKKIVAACQELSIRNAMPIHKLLADPAIVEIIEHQEANIPQKTSNLMAFFSENLSPRLVEAQRDFRHFSAGLRLPKHIRLSHSPSFERDTLSLTVEFANKEEFEKIWSSMATIV